MFLELILSIDYAVHNWFNAVRSDSFTTFFSFITIFGNWWFVIPCTVLSCIFLYHNKQWRLIPSLLFVLTSAEVTTYVLKILVARPRAFDALVIETDSSFPSGHAMIALALYGFLIYVVMRCVKTIWLRNASIAAFGVLIMLIGVSRLYLGVHYVSDVFMGYCIGGGALFVCTRFLIPHRAGVQ
jgi:undecaprenyl-diphosphatase